MMIADLMLLNIEEDGYMLLIPDIYGPLLTFAKLDNI
jgi:hypothetical protein